MIEIVNISLENEMDLISASRKTTKVADFFNLSLSAQTTFTTAVSEICREIIEKIEVGTLVVSLLKTNFAQHLVAQVKYEDRLGRLKESEEGFIYARRLVSQFQIIHNDDYNTCIEIRITLPKTSRPAADIAELINFFSNPENESPYELVKRRNFQLNRLSEKQQLELAHSNELNKKKSEFLSIASHELKTPLTIIKAYSQLALSPKSEHVDIRDFISKIEQQVNKINLLVERLLNFSKVEAGRLDFIMQPIAINDFIQNIFEVHKVILSSHRLQLLPGIDAMVLMDTLKIEQVLSNILNNAAKYSDAASTITITTERCENCIKIGIQDEGIGLAPETATKIFDKFFREEKTAKKYTGFGVGLYVAQQIVKEHKGQLWVDSILGSGSTFYFTLPLNIE